VLKRRKQQKATSQEQAVKDLKVSTWFLLLLGIASDPEAGHSCGFFCLEDIIAVAHT
jgi:hypothetical protein